MSITIGLLIPLLGTMLGSAFVFFMRDEMSARLQKTLLGFASGVMVAASVWSLLILSRSGNLLEVQELYFQHQCASLEVILFDAPIAAYLIFRFLSFISSKH